MVWPQNCHECFISTNLPCNTERPDDSVTPPPLSPAAQTSRVSKQSNFFYRLGDNWMENGVNHLERNVRGKMLYVSNSG